MDVNGKVHLADDYCLLQEIDANSSESSTVLMLCYNHVEDSRFTVYPYGLKILFA